MKKSLLKLIILSFIITALLSCSTFAKEEPKTASREVINTIQLLEIANGDENGNMNYGANVTRAEFIKMAINASSSKKAAANIKLNVSLFPDVKNSHWAAGYISIAINNGLVKGYLDGTFKPSNNVTLEEAATIVLRLLGYTSDDLSGNYPTVQLNKYRDLNLDDNITANQGDKLTREQCMILIYNMLSAETKSGVAYCTTLGYAVDAEDNLDYPELLKSKLEGPILVTDINNPFGNTNFKADGDTTYLLNDNNSDAVNFRANDVLYYSDVLNKVCVYRKNATGIVSETASSGTTIKGNATTTSSGSMNSPNGSVSSGSSMNVTSSVTSASGNSTVKLSGTSYNIATTAAKNKLAFGGEFYGEDVFVTLILGINDEVVDVIAGDSALLDSNENNASYLDLIDLTISSPIYMSSDTLISSWSDNIPFNVKEASVYVNGKSTSDYEIRKHDVIYYSKPFKNIWIFRSAKSGVISASSQQSVTIGSGSYMIATNDVKLKVSAYGEYGVNDYVTLILGKNDEIIDIIDADTSNIGNTDNDSSYSEVVSGTLKGPYVVGENGEMNDLKISKDSSRVFYENSEIDSSSIAPNDVYYYSEALNTVWIYRNTVSGTIEEITTSSSPVSVTISGKTYKITSSQASFDLSSFGKFNVGDKVTLLLGMDNDVAYVKSAGELSGTIYGIITAKGEKIFTDKYGDNYTAKYITVSDTTGTSRTYEYGNNSFSVGDVVRVSVGKTIQISLINEQLGRSEIVKLISAIKNGDFTENCEIIDVQGTSVMKVLPSRISGCELEIEQFTYSTIVLYYEMKDNKISKLILNNFTGDMNDYGIVVSSKSGNVDYRIDAVERSFTSSSGSSCSQGPAKFKKENGSIVSASALTGCVDNIDLITETAVYDTNENEYLLDDNVRVFIKATNTTFKYVEIEDVLNGEYSLKAYYDKLPKYGGRIRVIIAVKKV